MRKTISLSRFHQSQFHLLTSENKRAAFPRNIKTKSDDIIISIEMISRNAHTRRAKRMREKNDEGDDAEWIVAYRIGIRPIRSGTKRQEEEEEIQDINTYTNTNLIPPRRFRSARYPITHKALITQLISIYLITPSLPGTISTGPGRESPSASSSCPNPSAQSPLASRSFVRLFLSLCSSDPSRKSSTRPCYSHSAGMRIAFAWTCAVNTLADAHDAS